MDMTPEYDIILGDRWLIQNQAVIDYGEQTCSLRQGNRRFGIANQSCSSNRKSERVQNLDPYAGKTQCMKREQDLFCNGQEFGS